jgi:hypothetical protein
MEIKNAAEKPYMLSFFIKSQNAIIKDKLDIIFAPMPLKKVLKA